MLTAIVIVFVVAYAAIALEHPLKVNKSASALIGAGLLWTIYALSTGDHHLVSEQLGESLMGDGADRLLPDGGDDHRRGGRCPQRLRGHHLAHQDHQALDSLMWLVGFVTFFLSAVLDNLTTTIVMISLMKKLLDNHDDRLFFAGIIVIAANAGGAWTPIGDVTTTMLWIGGQITTLAIMKGVFLASMINLLVPLAVTSYILQGTRGRQPGKIELNAVTACQDHPLRAEPDVLHGARHPDRRADLQDRHPSAAVHGHPLRPRHPLAGRRTAPPQQGG